MTLHREGKGSIIIAVILFLLINFLTYKFLYPSYPIIFYFLLIVTLVVLGLVISFFRIPNRNYTINPSAVVAPCDGKVVVIEEVQADEYFSDRRIQVSIFMSPLNVHVNRNPVAGEVVYNQYHKGKYLVAWHPKSSTENERHSNVYRVGDKEVLTKQIAGALAKRIVNYLSVGDKVTQAGEMGFIKFGSRVDLLLPLNADIKVKIGDVAVGGITEIAHW
ncbi:phosphatidylserine decarboxylase family protein [Niabella ginsengisoli]|uniref:Phosphatidylserine decarboxylase family protein n=1 Tax=Niabella ginsengisoli TaxID=522298 RepID=A0ABS9SDU0_9BACT|nr:phosphatidylserine decarboxylase family protein [Niabella ginsengisoli]MCH5596519.1 phosphatidylserine decarboxylase family protein [Niabella ginsengisoli]